MPLRRQSGAKEPLIQIYGNTHGLKASQVRQIERLFRRHIPANRLITQEFARQLTEISVETRRQIGVLVDRRGTVAHVMVGNAHSIEMPDWGRLRAGRGRLRGLRCIQTHLSEEGLSRDNLTDLALLKLDAYTSVEARGDGLPGTAYTAALRPGSGEATEMLDPAAPAEIDFDFQAWIRDLENDLARAVSALEVGEEERAILVSVTAGRNKADVEQHTAELKELARSAGVQVVDVVSQQRPRVDPATMIGKGKLQDLNLRAFQTGAELVIFDQELTPTQARNLSDRMELRVLDRTQLILDIFAQHAKTGDGKQQVELAQLRYRMPRLAQRADLSLSRLAGGIGGRGPGETKLEVDRRRVRDRVARLEKAMNNLSRQRLGRRRRRDRREVPVLSIVGYTNAGKSTLLRALTGADVPVEDRMFATLDPVSRRLRFPREREVIITDTVGFIRDLPPDLVAAFRATLEELSDADVLLHLVDASAPDPERRIEAVRTVLDGLELGATKELLVFNQIDKLEPEVARALAARHGAVAVSALERKGLEELLSRAEQLLWSDESEPENERLAAKIA